MTWCSRSIVRKTRKTRTIKFLAQLRILRKAWGLPELISEVKKVDDNRVRFMLTRLEAPFLADPVMDFASILSKEYADAMMKAGTPEKLDLNPIGTGPFQLCSTKRFPYPP